MIDECMMIGMVLERLQSTHPWSAVAGQGYSWLPAGIFTTPPETPAWTQIGGTAERRQVYAGQAELHFYSTDTANYRDNLTSGAPKLWVALRKCDNDPPIEILRVTADPAEGEALTEAGDNQVETIAMPADIAGALAGFIAAHHVERPIVKRKRDRAAPELRWRAEPTQQERREVGEGDG